MKSIEVAFRFANRIDDTNEGVYRIKKSFDMEKKQYVYWVGDKKILTFPLGYARPSMQFLLGNPSEIRALLLDLLSHESLGIDDFIGGFCFDIDGKPWGYYRDSSTIGATFDYLGYIDQWLKAIPRIGNLEKNQLSIYGRKFKLQQRGDVLQLHFIGKGYDSKAAFLRFYSEEMWEPVLVDYDTFQNKLWTAYERYLKVLDVMEKLLTSSDFREIPVSKFDKNKIIIEQYFQLNKL